MNNSLPVRYYGHRIFLIAISSVLSIIASYAQSDYRKMSPLVREAWFSTAMSGYRAKPAFGATARVGSIVAFVKITDDHADVLAEYGGKSLLQKGSLHIAELPLNSLGPLSADIRVIRIEAGRRTSALMDTTRVIVNAPEVNGGWNLPHGFTGKGVVVGVQDIGFDLTHPNFFSGDMSNYRIKAMWDQLSMDTANSRLPVGRDYVGRDALLQVKHPRDGRIQTHGTHTAGIAVGSGAEGNGVVSTYRGIAYESDLCLVSNATEDDAELIDSADYYKYTYATDALGFKYIFDYADSRGQPCVINFSEGSPQDFQGYDQLYYEMLDSLCGPGHIIVSSAGNEGAKINYVRKGAGQSSAGVFINSNAPYVYLTTKAGGSFTFNIRVYADHASPVLLSYASDTVLAQTDSLLTDTIVVDSVTYALKVKAYPSGYDAREIVCDWKFTSLGHTFSQCYPVSVEMTGQQAEVTLFPVRGYFFHSDIDSRLKDGDNSHCIFSPSSAPSVICVGATGYRTSFLNYRGERKVYNNGTDGVRAPFSSVGPTVDGRIKPDVMAPGQNIVSSYSSFYLEHNPQAGDISSDVRHFDYNGRTYAWNSNAGTSMSAPVVAGVIALWLQANPTLTPADCLEVFRKTCKRYDPSLDYPNNLYGYGEIDAFAGMQEVLKMAAAGIKNLSADASEERIYSIDGRYVGTCSSGLPKGIYIIKGRKILVKN